MTAERRSKHIEEQLKNAVTCIRNAHRFWRLQHEEGFRQDQHEFLPAFHSDGAGIGVVRVDSPDGSPSYQAVLEFDLGDWWDATYNMDIDAQRVRSKKLFTNRRDAALHILQVCATLAHCAKQVAEELERRG